MTGPMGVRGLFLLKLMRFFTRLPGTVTQEGGAQDLMGPTPWDKKDRTDRLACQQAGVGKIDLGRSSANTHHRLRRLGRDVAVLAQAV